MRRFEYKTEVLTSLMGREKLDRDDLDKLLNENGKQGWELTHYTLNANVKGERDGHLLLFKREIQP